MGETIKRAVAFSAAAAAFAGMVSSGKGVRRVTADSKAGRRLFAQTHNSYGNSSSHKPHIGMKQQTKDLKRHIAKVKCGCTIQTLKRDCVYHGKLIAEEFETLTSEHSN